MLGRAKHSSRSSLIKSMGSVCEPPQEKENKKQKEEDESHLSRVRFHLVSIRILNRIAPSSFGCQVASQCMSPACGSNAYWLVSENHNTAYAAFREPLLCSRVNSSSRSRFLHYVSIMDSGYRTRYPLVVITTVCSAGLGSCRLWQGKHCQGFGITLRFLRDDTHSTAPLS